MGDIEDRRELSNKELSDLEYRKFKDQDKQFEVLHDVIRVNKYNAEEISHEADQHLQILDGLDENVDGVSRELRINDTKLQKLMRKSSNCCLFAVLAVLLICIGVQAWWLA